VSRSTCSVDSALDKHWRWIIGWCFGMDNFVQRAWESFEWDARCGLVGLSPTGFCSLHASALEQLILLQVPASRVMDVLRVLSKMAKPHGPQRYTMEEIVIHLGTMRPDTYGKMLESIQKERS